MDEVDRMKDLCRLCAKKHESAKDLLDDNNKYVLDIIRQFTQISVTECDNMPTKVCLDCEEKMVSFQIFILECFKVQDCLRKLCLENLESNCVKTEEVIDFGTAVIKSEVKEELSAEDLLTSAIQNNVEGTLDHYDEEDFQNVSSEDDEMDNICIASLKQLKSKTVQEKKQSREQLYKWRKKRCKSVEEYVKLRCSFCEEAFKSWVPLKIHFSTVHHTRPIIYCACGFAIHSKSVLYKHVTDHKIKTRKNSVKIISDGETLRGENLKISDYVTFKCMNCSKQCLSWYKLKSHCERSHRTPPVVSCRCGIELKSKSVLYKHIQDHKNPSNLSCDICSKIMKSVAALTKHRLRHVPVTDRKFSCNNCDRVFNSKELLRSHARSHIPIEERKVFNCDICNLKFTTRSSVASHRRVVHDKVKAYVCDLCGYACGTNGELRQHRAIHSDDKPFVCGKCAKPFKTYSNLKTHMDTHEDTSYVCYVCSRVLNSRRTLRKHLLVHEDKCRHVCSYCNKAFKRRQTLKVHMCTHTGDKPLACKWCDERFSYASTLRSHRLRAHPDKMAAQAHAGYHAHAAAYSHAAQLQHHQEYIKSDLAAIGITKNEAEATQ